MFEERLYCSAPRAPRQERRAGGAGGWFKLSRSEKMEEMGSVFPRRWYNGGRQGAQCCWKEGGKRCRDAGCGAMCPAC